LERRLGLFGERAGTLGVFLVRCYLCGACHGWCLLEMQIGGTNAAFLDYTLACGEVGFGCEFLDVIENGVD
jgi:hypothetical protein